jgi:ATP/maltotriose-dependent transcriptional regulator MalT
MARMASPPRLRGRAAEIDALSEALDRVESGRPATVLIEGEPGIGKSRLLAAAIEEAESRHLQVVAGRAEELDQTRPFGLAAGVFGCVSSSADPRRAAIAGLLAAQGDGDRGPITVTSDPGLQFRAVDAFAELAEQLALAGPLVIGVDDLQWADPSSLLTLGTLVRRLGYLPVALVGCMRPAPRIAELERLADLLHDAGGRRLTVGGLGAEAVTELAAESVAAEPGPQLLAAIAGAAGNPLFVTELLAALDQEQAIQTTAGRAEVARTAMPPTLRLTILRRLSFLPEAALTALRAASILGSSFTFTELSVTMAQPALDLAWLLAEGITAQVLEDDGARLRFRHDLIREALYADLPLSVRRGLHREAGQRLAESGAPVLQVAEQLARGAGAGDAEAIEWLSRAAREAAAKSPAAAADLLERAIGLMDPADPGRDRLMAERASSLVLSGRIAEAVTACRLLLDRGLDPAVEGPVRICLAQALFARGQENSGLTELEQLAQSPGLTSADRAAAQGWAAAVRLAMGDLDGAAASAEQARSAAAAAGDYATTSTALAALALVAELRGRLGDAIRIIDDGLRLADQSPGRQGHRHPLSMTRGHILVELDRLEEARATLDTGRRVSEEFGVRWHLPGYQAVRGMERFIAGEWDDAIAELEASVELADETGSKYTLAYALGVRSLIDLHRNDLRGARAAATAAGEYAGAGLRFRAQWAAWAQALLLEADGQAAAALTTLAECWDRCAELGFTLDYRLIGTDLVRLALAGGEPGMALDVAAAVTEVADQNDVSSLTGAALRCRGLAEDDAELLYAAARAYERGPRQLELALAREDAGAAFARRGDMDRGRSLLDQAIASYERLDAARDLARADATLRSAGIRRGRRGARKRPQIGWRGLTPTERTVAGLVAEGLSNPQIGERLYVSSRTVQTHLAHVFAKLDISSRAQLAAEVTRHRGTAHGPAPAPA